MLNIVPELNKQLLWISNYFWVQNYQHYISWLDKSITYSEQTWLLECRNDFWRNVLPNMLLLGQNAVLVVKKTLQNFYQWFIVSFLNLDCSKPYSQECPTTFRKIHIVVEENF